MAVLIVHDDESAVLTLELPGSGTEGNGILTNAGTLSVDIAPDEDVIVNLTSLTRPR